MISLPQMAAAVVAVGSIGGGALALDKMHVASEDFKEYIEQQQMADERDYVREIKKDIRDVQGALLLDPNEEYLIEYLAELMDELCELRPDDRVCDERGL
jgi:hypothetical protein